MRSGAAQASAQTELSDGQDEETMDETKTLLERIRDHEDSDAQPSPDALAKREVAGQLRALSHAIGKSGASAEQLRDIAAQLRRQRDLLDGSSPAGVRAEPAASSAVPGMEDFRDRSPVTGQANPMAPPATLAADLDARVVTGEVSFGPAFEGCRRPREARRVRPLFAIGTWPGSRRLS